MDLAAVHSGQRRSARKTVGEKHARYQHLLSTQAEFWSNLARRREAAKDQPAARRAHEVVLQLCAEGFAPKHWLAVDSRIAVARMDLIARLSLAQQKRLASAAGLDYAVQNNKHRGSLVDAQTSLRIRRELLGASHPDVAVSLNSLGMLHRLLGEYTEAVPMLRQAWEVRRQALGEEHPQTALSLNNLGQAYYSAGNWVEAAECFQRSLSILEKVVGPRHNAYITALNNLAVLHQDMGDHAGAEPMLRRGLELYLLAQSDPLEVRLVRGALLPRLSEALRGEINWVGALDWSFQYYKEASNYVDPLLLAFLNNLGRAHLALGKFDLAEQRLREAVQRFQDQAGKTKSNRILESAGYATALNNLAMLYLGRKKFDQAAPLLDLSLAIRKKVYREKHSGYAVGLTSLAALYFQRGESARAEEHLKAALTIREQALGKQSLYYAFTLSNLALLHDAKGEPEKALPLARLAVQISGAHLSLTSIVQSERQQLVQLKGLRGLLDHYLSLAVRCGAKGKEAYGPMLAWKGSLFVRQRLIREQRLFQGAGQEEAAKLRADLEDVVHQLASLARVEMGALKKIEDLSARKEQLERELASKTAAVRERRQAEQLTPAGLQAALPRDTALVDFLEFLHHQVPAAGKGKRSRRPHMLAVVVRNGQPITLHDLGPSEWIHKAVGDWRRTVSRRTLPLQGKDDPAGELRRLVWAPLEKSLAGAHTVIVSPDGPLNRMPLGALPGKEDGKYLLEELAIAVLAVPQELPALLARPRQGRIEDSSLLVVGDVDFDAVGPALVRLPDPLPPSGPPCRPRAARCSPFAIASSASFRFPTVRPMYCAAGRPPRQTSACRRRAIAGCTLPRTGSSPRKGCGRRWRWAQPPLGRRRGRGRPVRRGSIRACCRGSCLPGPTGAGRVRKKAF